MISKSFNNILKQYDPMVRNIIKKLSYEECYTEDLLQEGRILLYKAYHKFNKEKYNNKFITYAYKCISLGLRRSYAKIAGYRDYRGKGGKIAKIDKFTTSFESLYNRKPTSLEIKEGVGFNEMEYKILNNYLSYIDSLYDVNTYISRSDILNDSNIDLSKLKEIVKNKIIETYPDRTEVMFREFKLCDDNNLKPYINNSIYTRQNIGRMKKQIIKNLYKDKNISKYLDEIKENY